MYEAVGPTTCEWEDWKLDFECSYCFGCSCSFSGPSQPYGLYSAAILEFLSNQEATSPAKANEWLGQSRYGVNGTEKRTNSD